MCTDWSGIGGTKLLRRAATEQTSASLVRAQFAALRALDWLRFTQSLFSSRILFLRSLLPQLACLGNKVVLLSLCAHSRVDQNNLSCGEAPRIGVCLRAVATVARPSLQQLWKLSFNLTLRGLVNDVVQLKIILSLSLVIIMKTKNIFLSSFLSS